MCIVNDIKVDEAVLRQVMPELDSNAAIRLWVQKLVDEHLQQLRRLPESDMIPNDVCREIWQEVENEYKDVAFDDDDEAIDLEEAREILLRTVREEYARP